MNRPLLDRPDTTVVLAMSADGKIAGDDGQVTFTSKADYAHLERQVAAADAVLVGAATLRAGRTAMRVQNSELIESRVQQGKPEQPAQIICTRSARLDPEMPFFRQSIPRWLLTTNAGAQDWEVPTQFDQVLVHETDEQSVDWEPALARLKELGIEKLAVLGGGEIVAALLAADLIDEIYLTVCPLLMGGSERPTLVGGPGFPVDEAPRLALLNLQQVDQELFLHYKVEH